MPFKLARQREAMENAASAIQKRIRDAKKIKLAKQELERLKEQKRQRDAALKAALAIQKMQRGHQVRAAGELDRLREQKRRQDAAA